MGVGGGKWMLILLAEVEFGYFGGMVEFGFGGDFLEWSNF